MRTLILVGAACLVLMEAALPAQAQGVANFLSPGTRAATFSGSSAQTVINTPIDTSLAIAPFPGQNNPFWLPGFFHNLHMPSWPTIVGVSPLPAPDSFASTHYTPARTIPFKKLNSISPTGFVPISYKEHD